MRRISLAALSIFASTLFSLSQAEQDSSAYKSRKLRLDEINFVSGYYRQDGNNSAVTGGIGSEELTDFATTLDVRLSHFDRRGRKRSIGVEVGVDFYTSASSDMIDPQSISSASSQDVRVYPSISYNIANEERRSTMGITGSVSTEYDYLSMGAGLSWAKRSINNNRELTIKGQVFLDTWSVILPIELRGPDSQGKAPRNTYSTSFTLSQVFTRRLQALFVLDLAYQEGQLATLYHRTYFSADTHRNESLPATRFKVPLGLRLNYFAGDRFIVRSFYRFYADTWGLRASTAELETPVKITPFISISPFYRYYKQQGVSYFAGYGLHDPGEVFYTSDYDLSTLTSHMMGMGIRLAPPGGLFGIAWFNAVELRYGHYSRSTGLSADIISIQLKYK
jgi:hypothetical protein